MGCRPWTGARRLGEAPPAGVLCCAVCLAALLGVRSCSVKDSPAIDNHNRRRNKVHDEKQDPQHSQYQQRKGPHIGLIACAYTC